MRYYDDGEREKPRVIRCWQENLTDERVDLLQYYNRQEAKLNEIEEIEILVKRGVIKREEM